MKEGETIVRLESKELLKELAKLQGESAAASDEILLLTTQHAKETRPDERAPTREAGRRSGHPPRQRRPADQAAQRPDRPDGREVAAGGDRHHPGEASDLHRPAGGGRPGGPDRKKSPQRDQGCGTSRSEVPDDDMEPILEAQDNLRKEVAAGKKEAGTRLPVYWVTATDPRAPLQGIRHPGRLEGRDGRGEAQRQADDRLRRPDPQGLSRRQPGLPPGGRGPRPDRVRPGPPRLRPAPRRDPGLLRDRPVPLAVHEREVETHRTRSRRPRIGGEWASGFGIADFRFSTDLRFSIRNCRSQISDSNFPLPDDSDPSTSKTIGRPTREPSRPLIRCRSPRSLRRGESSSNRSPRSIRR